MAVSKQNNRNNKYKLRGRLKKQGFNRWRYICTGQDSETGEEAHFFIELCIINPAQSPNNISFGYQPELPDNEQNIQELLTNATLSTPVAKSQPSYVCVRAGICGTQGKQINNFYPINELSSGKDTFSMKVGPCLFTDTQLEGKVSLSGPDTELHPEFFSDSGTIAWKIKYEREIDFTSYYNGKGLAWIPTGAKTTFTGSLRVNNKQYILSSIKNSGYSDIAWGASYPEPFFHLSSSSLSSVITGRKLTNSCFAIQGLYNNKLCVYADFENQKLSFVPHPLLHRYEATWECNESPESKDGKRLHWSVSVNDKHYIIDIDIYCKTTELFVQTCETPKGNNTLLKNLCSASGYGEIRFYKKVKRTVEMIEHAHATNVFCAYGTTDNDDTQSTEDELEAL